jgi:hypothetical protein
MTGWYLGVANRTGKRRPVVPKNASKNACTKPTMRSNKQLPRKEPLHSVQDLKQDLGRITEECSGDQTYEAESNGAHPAVSLPTIYDAERYARDNHANGPNHSKCDFKKIEHILCLL